MTPSLSALAVPAHYQLLYSQEAINKRVRELGQEIGAWALKATERSGKQVMVVAILRGGAIFFSDLVRAIPVPIEPAFCRTWSYSTENNEHQKGIRISVDDVQADGRAIILIDDICDTGSTLLKLHNVFCNLGAVEVKSVVLLRRQSDNPKYAPTWEAFSHVGKDWFVGYGMDDRNHMSNLPDVYAVAPGSVSPFAGSPVPGSPEPASSEPKASSASQTK
jgi:hypoxanthine phosphoribosyltransferase